MSSALNIALGSVNAAPPRMIDAATLRACLKGQTDWRPWRWHLDAFFGDLSLSVIERVVAEEKLEPARLLALYRALGETTGLAEAGKEAWLAELARAA